MKRVFKINYRAKARIVFDLHLFREFETFKNTKYINKVFCIGFVKTGTKSLAYVLKKLGFEIGNQAVAEILSEDWAKGNTERIIRYCQTADAFQDMPFSTPGLYKHLDKSFPNSKFILTIRDNEEQWYNSLIQYHTKLYASDKYNPPTKTDLKNSNYRYKGWIFNMIELFFNYPEVDLYDRRFYQEKYRKHIEDVMFYFKDRPNDLLILNVSEYNSYQRLYDFLGINLKIKSNKKFPWLNKT